MWIPGCSVLSDGSAVDTVIMFRELGNGTSTTATLQWWWNINGGFGIFVTGYQLWHIERLAFLLPDTNYDTNCRYLDEVTIVKRIRNDGGDTWLLSSVIFLVSDFIRWCWTPSWLECFCCWEKWTKLSSLLGISLEERRRL